MFRLTELESKSLDLETLKKQTEGTNKEYDRLLKEFAQVQVKSDVALQQLLFGSFSVAYFSLGH